MSSQSVSESRFFMWRAVIAMAHADKTLDPKERELVESYLKNVPFSEPQRKMLLKDLDKPADPAKMFALITEPEDRGTFFQFARLMVWSDGDLDAQEQRILERLHDVQMARFSEASLEEMVRESREDSRLLNIKDDVQFENSAKKIVGLGAILSRLTW